MTAEHTTLLRTARLRLRRFEPDDLESLIALDSDPLVMRYISRGVATSRAYLERAVLPEWIAGYASGSCIGFWAADACDDRAFAGWFHLRRDRFNREDIELGYRLRRASWGQGLATEGSLALIERAFRRERVPSISARALIGNVASRRVMEKCGLRFIEEFHYPSQMLKGWTREERRAVRYLVHREAWLRRPPAIA